MLMALIGRKFHYPLLFGAVLLMYLARPFLETVLRVAVNSRGTGSHTRPCVTIATAPRLEAVPSATLEPSEHPPRPSTPCAPAATSIPSAPSVIPLALPAPPSARTTFDDLLEKTIVPNVRPSLPREQRSDDSQTIRLYDCLADGTLTVESFQILVHTGRQFTPNKLLY